MAGFLIPIRGDNIPGGMFRWARESLPDGHYGAWYDIGIDAFRCVRLEKVGEEMIWPPKAGAA